MIKKRITLSILILIVNICAAQSILDTKINFSIENSSIVDALDKLSAQTTIAIAFSSRFFDSSEKKSFDYKNKKISYILEDILYKTAIHIKLVDNQVILFPGKPRQIKKYTLSGYLEDAKTGEKLIAAAVFFENLSIGAISNEYGFFSLTIPGGEVDISFRYIGYKEENRKIHLNQNIRLNISLSPHLTLIEVIVKPQKDDESAAPLAGRGQEIYADEIESAPSISGESDVSSAVQLLSSVEPGTDNVGAMFVRGGTSGQNLVLFDGIPVYSATHIPNLFSIFGTNVIRSSKLITGSFPARYGGRTSSILDIRTREGNRKRWSATGGINLISKKITLEGPFAQKKGAILINIRKANNDDLYKESSFSELNPVKLIIGESGKYDFYDFTAKINYTFSYKDRLFLSYYKGKDSFIEENSYNLGVNETILQSFSSQIKLRNDLYALRWNHLFSDKLFLNTTITRSHYYAEYSRLTSYHIIDSLSNYDFLTGISEIKDNTLLMDFNYYSPSKHTIHFGINFTRHTFKPVSRDMQLKTVGENLVNSLDITYFLQQIPFLKFKATESHIYIEDIYHFSKKGQLNLGGRGIFFNSNKTYFSFSPRLTLRYQWNDKFSTYAFTGRMMQYLHLVTSFNNQTSWNVWFPTADNLPSQKAWHFSAGMDYEVAKKTSASLSIYYKKMRNIPHFLPKSDTIINGNFDFIHGKGWAYGAEFSIKKSFSKTGGWFNYTLSWAKRQFDVLNDGKKFSANYDRRHQFKLFFYHRFSRRFQVSTSYIYASPNPKIFIGNDPNEQFDPTNRGRSKPFHKLNISFNWALGKRRLKHFIKIGLSNAYNRENINLYDVSNFNGVRKEYKIPLLPILPFFSYHFKY